MDGDFGDLRNRYDVIVAGGRVAGASTAMLLARAGLDVLVVDPVPAGRDTLSTHAIMRAGVLQLSRWGLLDEIGKAGTPVIDATTFHYGPETIRLEIEPRDGIDGLYAPRRTVLDKVLISSAAAAGATVVHGMAVRDLLRSDNGRIVGATLSGRGHVSQDIRATLVIGADGMNSRVRSLVGATATMSVPHSTACTYGYVSDLEMDGFHWYYAPEAAIGLIPTNDGETCVFASVRPGQLEQTGGSPLARLLHGVVETVSPELAETLANAPPIRRVRGFAGAPSALYEGSGPGWALVGDAGYFKDPLTAHGISDALRDAELLARAVVSGGASEPALDVALKGYIRTRDRLSEKLLEVTSRIASLDWTLGELKGLHLTLSRAMAGEVREMREWAPIGTSRSAAT